MQDEGLWPYKTLRKDFHTGTLPPNLFRNQQTSKLHWMMIYMLVVLLNAWIWVMSEKNPTKTLCSLYFINISQCLPSANNFPFAFSHKWYSLLHKLHVPIYSCILYDPRVVYMFCVNKKFSCHADEITQRSLAGPGRILVLSTIEIRS